MAALTTISSFILVLQASDNRLNLRLERRHILAGSVKDATPVDAVVQVNNDISHVDDLSPGNAGTRIPERLLQPGRGFPDNSNVSHDVRLDRWIGVKFLWSRRQVSLDFGDGVEDVLQQKPL
jgi:hypothetical protein